MSIFGAIKDGTHVESAMLEHLELWQLTYLAEVERQNGLEPRFLPAIRSFVVVKEFDRWPEDQLPACLVLSPGLAEPPIAEGDGTMRSKWILGIGLVCSAPTREDTNRLAKWYTSAMRAAILQHPSLGGFAEGVEWRSETFSDIPSAGQRTMSSGQAVFFVEVRDTVNRLGGPTSPPEDPYNQPDDWPEVDSVQVTVEKED